MLKYHYQKKSHDSILFFSYLYGGLQSKFCIRIIFSPTYPFGMQNKTLAATP